jgi:hypothetical protein
MKYAKPELTELTDAILAIQQTGNKDDNNLEDHGKFVSITCYEDNE